jgi:hypothetical protein
MLALDKPEYLFYNTPKQATGRCQPSFDFFNNNGLKGRMLSY